MVRIGVDHSCAFYKSWTPGCFFHRSKERYPLKFIRLRQVTAYRYIKAYTLFLNGPFCIGALIRRFGKTGLKIMSLLKVYNYSNIRIPYLFSCAIIIL